MYGTTTTNNSIIDETNRVQHCIIPCACSFCTFVIFVANASSIRVGLKGGNFECCSTRIVLGVGLKDITRMLRHFRSSRIPDFWLERVQFKLQVKGPIK